MRIRAIALASVLLPGAALSALAAVDEAPLVEQETVVALTQGAAVTRKSATETLRGVIDGVDEGNDTIKIRLSPDSAERFKVQDGLIFNAVRYGDQVEIIVESIEGAKTIVELRKE